MPEIPKPNAQALSWFYGEDKKKTLDLIPKYQRNPIWSIGQKCFLIDSLIFGAPIPQVVINIQTHGRGRERRTVYEVVDGQQRLRAILEFMNDEWALVATTARSYPVSEIYKPHIGKKYSELPGSLQETIWNYQLAVQELRGWDDGQIRALFRRLNYVVEKLNKQELRHSQYFGEFVETVEDLTKDDFWDDIGVFTRRDSQRMKDVEFVSELFVIIIDGIQDGQSTLDRFYADYDVVFPQKSAYVAKFRQVLTSLRTLMPFLATSRFSKKADFYGLFAAAERVNAQSKQSANLASSIGRLKRLEQSLKKTPEEMSEIASRYYSTVIEGANKRPKREERAAILHSHFELGELQNRMPTQDREVVRKFNKRITVGIDYYRELRLAIHLKKRQASLETMLAEQFTFNCVVLWEVFLSDILLAYVIRNPASYLKGLKVRVSKSLKDRYGNEVARHTELTFPSKVTRLQAQAFVDPKQFNITAQSADVLSRKANELLAATYAKKFTLVPEDAQLVDFAIAIRNYLGHRSTAARAALKIALAPLGGINVDLTGDIRDVGVYLKGENAVGDTRAIIIAQRLTQVASQL